MKSKKFWFILVIILFVFLSGLWYGMGKKSPFSEVFGTLFSPLYKTGNSFGEGIREFFSNYLALVNLKKENERLRKELLILTSQLSYYKEREKLYQKLEKFFKISSKIRYPKVAARIIYKPLDPYSGVIFIDKGSREGILPQMPVLAEAGGEAVALIGQVVEVYPTWSKVILLTDPSFAADVKVETTDDRGILRGKAEKMCSLEYLPLYSKVKPGDMVITSGFDELFPPGLLIGKVVSVSRKEESSGLFKTAEVKPLVDFYKLDLVFVLIKVPKIPLQ